LQVTGTEPESAAVFEAKFGDYLGRPLDVDGLESDLTRLYADGYYARLGYEAERRGNSTLLRLEVLEKRHGPPFLRFHFDFQGGTRDETRFTFRTRALGRGPTGYRSEWRADLALGRTSEIGAEYFQPLGDTPAWLAPRVWLGTTRTDLFADDRRVAEYRTSQSGVGLDAGYDFGSWGQLSGGLAYGQIDQDTVMGLALRPAVDEAFGYLRGRFVVDTRDAPVLPRQGLRLDSELRFYTGALGAANDFTRLSTELQWSTPLGRRQTLFALADAGTTFGAAVPPYGEFTLGGLMRLNAYQRDRFRGANALHAGLGVLHQVAALPLFFGGKVYASGFYELGGAFDQFDQARFFSSLSAGW